MGKLNLSERKVWFLFSIVIIIFFIAEFKGLNNFDPGDEHVYIYMGKLIAEGKIMYKDFFNSHPPLHILITGLLYKFFGFKQFIFKLIPLISTIISSFFIFKFVKEKFGNMEAFISVILFLTSLELLKFSTYSIGINLTTMFVMVGFYYLYKNKDLISGLLFGLAGISGLYSLPAVLVVLPVLFLNNKKRSLKFLYGFLITFGIVNLLFIMIAGSNYWIPVYKYHLMKPAIEGYGTNIFMNVLKSNFILFSLPILYLFLKNKKQLSLMFAVIVVYFLFFAGLGRVFKFYFLIIFPLLAIVSGVALSKFATLIKKQETRNIIIGIFLVVLIFLGMRNAIFINQTYFAEFQIKDQMYNYIKRNSNSEEKIFGDISIVPMMALLSKRDIALDMVDTNKMVFESGVVDLKKVLHELDEENIKFIIIRPFTEIETIQEFKDYIEERCEVSEIFQDSYFGDFFVLDCSVKKEMTSEKGSNPD